MLDRILNPMAQSRPGLTSQPTFEQFIDLQTAAKLLQLHPDTLKKKTRDGEIPGHHNAHQLDDDRQCDDGQRCRIEQKPPSQPQSRRSDRR